MILTEGSHAAAYRTILPILPLTSSLLFSLYLILKCLGSNVFLKVTHQRNEVGQRERQPDVDGILMSLNRTQLLVVSPFFEQVVDETLLLISAPTAWHTHTHTQTLDTVVHRELHSF